MKIFFSVGEPSGDLHGANLIGELRKRRPDVECVGFGGPRMAGAGCQLLEDLTQFAVMWFFHALLHVPEFLRFLARADAYLQEHRPDAVVLIDYPGFNWWIARAAKKYDIPVFYYGVPQLWAWAPWRIRKMRRFVDYALCKLPFEEKWYRQRGCEATYVGHPYFDEMHHQELDEGFLRQYAPESGPLVTILPGSRSQEVISNLPAFLRVVERIHRSSPTARFAIAAFNERQAQVARAQVHADRLPVDVHVGRTAELIHAARCCLACSGSVSLELLYHQKPAVILYRITRLAYVAQHFMRRVKYITLVNLLASSNPFPKDLSTYDPDAAGAERVPFPEYLTCRDVSRRMAHHLSRWLEDESQHEACVSQLRTLKEQFARPGASRSAADFILKTLQATDETAAPPVAA